MRRCRMMINMVGINEIGDEMGQNLMVFKIYHLPLLTDSLWEHELTRAHTNTHTRACTLEHASMHTRMQAHKHAHRLTPKNTREHMTMPVRLVTLINTLSHGRSIKWTVKWVISVYGTVCDSGGSSVQQALALWTEMLVRIPTLIGLSVGMCYCQ